jgi:hypothetical protein
MHSVMMILMMGLTNARDTLVLVSSAAGETNASILSHEKPR